jgi:DNA-binding transcriptional ArsR family regulator
MMRALAHPARIAILQQLGLDGPATATECAAVVGLSPSACSYHLRALARYGFVEGDPASAADGRQRPWRVRIISMSFDEGEPGQPEALRAAGRLLTESLLARFECAPSTSAAPTVTRPNGATSLAGTRMCCT